MALLMAAVSLSSLLLLAGCKKSTFKVKNEKDAKEVYSFPKSNNKFGLEKIAIFEDRAVVVLDKEICDSFEDLDIRPDREFPNREYYYYLDISNRNHPYPDLCTTDVEITDGRYVVTLRYDNSPRYKRTSEFDYEITGIRLGDVYISIYRYSNTIEISCGGFNEDDTTWYYKQTFSTGKWEEPERGENPCSVEDWE